MRPAVFSSCLPVCRNRRCPKGRHYALSFLVLGAVASGYHGADRQSWLRPVMRKLDYYSICYTSTVLRRAAHIPMPNAAKAAAVLIAPFKPSIVTGLNLALVEVRARRQEGVTPCCCAAWVAQLQCTPCSQYACSRACRCPPVVHASCRA